MNKKLVYLIILITFASNIRAQDHSPVSFSALNLRSSARVAALGMDFLAWKTNDIGIGISNPSLIDSNMHNQINIGYTDLFAGIWQGHIAYSRTFNKVGSLGFGLNYVGYGQFKRTEASGDEFGEFSANDYMFTIAWSKQLEDNLFIGVSLKPVFSQYESYSSSAIAFDLAATYTNQRFNMDWTIMARNFGSQIKQFNNIKEKLPFDLAIGMSKELTHAPFRLFVMANNLHKWDLRENDPLRPRDRLDPFTGEIKRENNILSILDNGFRHIELGVDFHPSKLFYIAFGYSWKQSREMYLDDALSLAGISYGFGFNYRRYSFRFARNEYHRFGSPNHIGLSVKL